MDRSHINCCCFLLLLQLVEKCTIIIIVVAVSVHFRRYGTCSSWLKAMFSNLSQICFRVPNSYFLIRVLSNEGKSSSSRICLDSPTTTMLANDCSSHFKAIPNVIKNHLSSLLFHLGSRIIKRLLRYRPRE